MEQQQPATPEQGQGPDARNPTPAPEVLEELDAAVEAAEAAADQAIAEAEGAVEPSEQEGGTEDVQAEAERAPKNGARKKYSVGSRIVIGGDDGETLQSVLGRIGKLQERHSAVRMQAISAENALLRAIQATQQELQTMARAIGLKRGILKEEKTDEEWKFEPSDLSFKRVK